ncbi:phage/plasmid primase, P4 family [Lacticaseibacillus saniviri]|uniref:Primase n=1 Tax=Lacticaseibacillus saniviri JCM 17471 = DSM 24301 TaxID=1293598 RepID=A0A0R2MV64_9LACO|nr:phage/plasmid primase, P4 family [Lacticaseibacillus saniviri]KRO16160.1 primase [Lacticaseibacillus saniviri JCM 17471 = DSM 24301]
MYEKIPAELRALKQWGLYRRIWQPDKNKYTKIPYSANTGQRGSSTNEADWVTFDEALVALDGYQLDGLGFFFGRGYMGIDIDHIGGELERLAAGDRTENMAWEFLDATQSYSELSMSGEGLHIIVKGKLPGSRRRSGDIEMYQDGRFFAMTGNKIGPYEGVSTPPKENIKKLYTKYLEPKKVISLPSATPQSGPNNLSEDEIVTKMLNSKTGSRIKLLLQGGWEQFYSSQSEADLAFANDLAFWTGRDFTKMDAIFRQSSLMRDKWDEKHGKTTYGVATMNKAINETNSVYQPERERPKYIISFGGSDKPKEFPPRSWDDTGNADRFVDRFGEIARYSYIDKAWYIYNGSFLEQDQRGQLASMTDAVVADLKNEKLNIPADADEEAMRKAWEQFKKRSRSNAGKKAMMDELKHRLPVMPDEFDKDLTLFNVLNGYVDLSNGELKDHEISKMFSLQGNFEYTDTMDAPEWERFLDQIFNGDKDLIEYLQKALGYSLTGSNKEQVMFILHGNGRNGKSIFLETVSNIFGTYAKTIQAETIMVRKNSGPNTDIARLKGARLVTSSEPNEGYRMDEGLVKQLTGGDKVTARKLYGNEFEFEPQFKLWLATNHKPIIRGTDDGIWRRLMLIPFKVQIPDDKVDKDLKYKLERESVGILNWMVDGALKWQREGLNPPAIVTEASKGYREEMDVLAGFLGEVAETGPGFSVRSSELFKTYKQWAKDYSEYSMSSTKFGIEMAHKFTKRRIASGYVYDGVRIKPDTRLAWNV